ncbi:MAG: hypothetical protein HY721_27565 [Planctomycetes bacterium]|nr:hypothetical protein [Planctomycetota bacterium]
MSNESFGLLELGSNSLKFYLVEPKEGGGHAIKAHKVPWRVAHELFCRGSLGEQGLEEMVAAIRSVERVSEGVKLSSMIAVATGVFRELANISEVAVKVKADTGIRVRVIDGQDEARLMARSLRMEKREGSVLVCDLGGATTEWVRLQDGSLKGLGSLPLGAIRNEYRFRTLKGDPQGYLEASARGCDEALRGLEAPAGTAVLATGGTARAAAACAGKDRIPAGELREMIRRVLRDGPPASLKPERQAVLVPGLIILDRIVERCRSAHLEHTEHCVRDGMAFRLVQLLGVYRRDDLHATLLLNTRPA